MYTKSIRPPKLSRPLSVPKGSFIRDLPATMGLVTLAFVTFYPFLFLLVTSLKNNRQFYNEFWVPTLPLHPENYRIAFAQIYQYLANNLYYSAVTVTGVVFLASVSGYVFARHEFPGKRELYLSLLALVMIPGVLMLVPRFILVKQLGMLDKPQVLILPWMSGMQIIAITLVRTHIEGLPDEMFEAATIDGATDLQMFARLALPLSTPILGTVVIMNLLNTWNNFIWPLVTISTPAKFPLTVGLLTFQSGFSTRWGPLFAGYTLAALPLIVAFMFSVRYFVAGLTSGAIKM